MFNFCTSVSLYCPVRRNFRKIYFLGRNINVQYFIHVNLIYPEKLLFCHFSLHIIYENSLTRYMLIIYIKYLKQRKYSNNKVRKRLKFLSGFYLQENVSFLIFFDYKMYGFEYFFRLKLDYFIFQYQFSVESKLKYVLF